MTSLTQRARNCVSSRRGLACAALFLWSASLLSTVPVLAQQSVGFVLEMHGKWSNVGKPEFLKLGQSLPAEAVLANASPTDEDRIVIANLRGEIIKTIRCKKGVCRECTDSGACYDPIHPLPKTDDSAGSVPTLLNAVLNLFVEKPDRYSVHRVRGDESEGIRSEVLPLDTDTVELGSLLKGKEKGRYEAQLLPISRNSHRNENSRPFEGAINWNPGEKAAISLNGIAPGLYEVRLYRSSSTTTVWVLLCAGAEYRRSAESFDEFARQTESWGNNITSATKQAYQRAFLEYLDLQMPESHL